MRADIKEIPANITRANVLSAIQQADEEGVPKRYNSRTYFLHYNNKLYPPKYIIMIANKWANGEEFGREHFYSIDAAKYLKRLGFVLTVPNNINI